MIHAAISLAITACFAALSILHVLWVFRPIGTGVIPTENGIPVFNPTKAMILAVASALGAASLLTLSLHWRPDFLPVPVMRFGNLAVALSVGLIYATLVSP